MYSVVTEGAELPLNLIERDSEQLCCSINFLTKKIDRYVIESVPKSFLKPHVCGA